MKTPSTLFIAFLAAALSAYGTGYAVGAPDHVGEAIQALEQVQALGLASTMNPSGGALTETADGLVLVAGEAHGSPRNSAEAHERTLASAEAHVRIPNSAAEWLDSDRVARIRVPGAAGPAPLRVNTNTVLYSNTAPAVSTALTISVWEEDSLVEHFTILHDRTAPRDHRTEIALEAGETLVSTGPKEAAIIDASGNVIGTVEAPWASDLLGNDVPFEMTVEGNAVIVSVAHQEANYAYPIVVDPAFRRKCGWRGCRIYLSRRVTHELAGPVVGTIGGTIGAVGCGALAGIRVVP